MNIGRAVGLFLVGILLPPFLSPLTAQQETLPYGGHGLDVDIYGNVYVLNTEKNTIFMIDSRGHLVRELGGAGWGNEQFDHPSGIWARNGMNVFVADYGNHRIQRYDRTLSYVSTFTTRAEDDPRTRFGFPTDVSVSRLGDLFLCDTENVRILKVNRFTHVERIFGGFGGGEGRLQEPTQLEVGPNDHVYVLDEDRVVVFDAFGNYLSELGSGLLESPSSLFADERSVVVLSGGMLHCFDSSERLLLRVALEDMLDLAGEEVRAVSFGGGNLYLLVSDGVHVLGDPRAEKLDKEGKSP
jgi:DNA-binding beta-propeller fold protein YncE